MNGKILIWVVVCVAIVGMLSSASALCEYSNGELTQHTDELVSPIDHDGDGKLSVIVHYKEQPDFVDDLYLYAKSADIKQHYTGISAIACELSPEEIEKLQSDSAVAFVESDASVYAFGDMQTVGWGVFATDAITVQERGNNGQGVKVGIIDTGIDYNHPDLAANYITGYDFINGDPDPYDDHGHGTHVAGIVGALNNNIGTLGIAPQIMLYGVKVLDGTGKGSISDVISGLQYCVENDIDVVCMSLGTSYGSPALEEACEYAKNHGVVLVTAAGNSGDGDYNTDEISYPAAYDSTIAVGAIDINNLPAAWSNSGPYVSVCAPGVDILSTFPLSDCYYPSTGYGTLSGTSMAAPHVVGLVAQIIQAHPGYNPDEIKYVLEHSANDVYLEGVDTVTGYGLIDADAAVSYVITSSDLVPSSSSDYSGVSLGSIYWEYGGESIKDWRRVGAIVNGSAFAVGRGEGFGSDVSANQKVLERYVYFPGSQTVLKFWAQARRGGDTSDWDYTMSVDGVEMASFKNSIDTWTEYTVSVAGFPEGIHKLSFMAQWRGSSAESNQKVGFLIDSVRLYAGELLPFSYVVSESLAEQMDINAQSVTVTVEGDVAALTEDDAHLVYLYDSLDTMTGWTYYSVSPIPNLYSVSSSFGYTGAQSITGRTSIKGLGRVSSGLVPDDDEAGVAYRMLYFPTSPSPPVTVIEFDTQIDEATSSGAVFLGGGLDEPVFTFLSDGRRLVDMTDLPAQWVHTSADTTGYAGAYPLYVYSFCTDSYSLNAYFDELVLYMDAVDPAFEVDVAEGAYPLTVEFSETTVDGLGCAPAAATGGGVLNYVYERLWNFGDGSSSNDPAPTHTYLSPGKFDVTLTNQYAIADQITETEVTDYINVSEAGVVTFDCNFTGNPTSGESPLEVTFTGTCEGVGDVTYMWDFGDGYSGYGQETTHTYTTYGSNQTFSVALATQTDNGTGTCTKASYIIVNGSETVSAGSDSYTLHQVRFLIVDQFGKPIPDVVVVATAEETTGSWGWLTSWFGIPDDVDIENTVMNGSTGSNGALVFSMVESVKYRLDISAPATSRRDAITTTVFMYPLESEQMITLIPDRELSSEDALEHTLWSELVDDDTIRVGLTYSDVTQNTTRLEFTVYNTTVDESGGIVYETLYGTSVSNPLSTQELYYDFDYMGGETLVWGFEVDHAIYGPDISKYQYITIESLRPLIDFAPWIPLDVYNWMAIAMLVSMAAVFSYLSLKFGVVVVPIFGGLLKYWGYLICPWMIVSIAIALGIVIYARISESESDV